MTTPDTLLAAALALEAKLDEQYEENRRLTERIAELEAKTSKALHCAVSALYFDNDSDFITALWEVAGLLGGEEAVALLESDASAAFHKYEPRPC